MLSHLEGGDAVMKLVMASFFEEENHGSGRKIGIAPSKPENADCDFRFDPLDPDKIYWDYIYDRRRNDPKAGDKFVDRYTSQCEKFLTDVKKQAKEQGKEAVDLLPFKEGDTLLSWENKGHLTYRRIAAEYLRKLGYEVEEN